MLQANTYSETVQVTPLVSNLGQGMVLTTEDMIALNTLDHTIQVATVQVQV